MMNVLFVIHLAKLVPIYLTNVHLVSHIWLLIKLLILARLCANLRLRSLLKKLMEAAVSTVSKTVQSALEVLLNAQNVKLTLF